MNAEIRIQGQPALRLDGSPLILGRGDDCDLRVVHDRVSRQHARFVERDGRWHVCDLGSANGVQVEFRTITEETALVHGDTITLGTLRATFHDPSSIPPKVARIESTRATVPSTTTPSTTTPSTTTPPTPSTPVGVAPSRPTTPDSHRAVRRRGTKGVGLLALTLIIFSALFGVIYFIYDLTFAPESNPPVAKQDADPTPGVASQDPPPSDAQTRSSPEPHRVDDTALAPRSNRARGESGQRRTRDADKQGSTGKQGSTDNQDSTGKQDSTGTQDTTDTQDESTNRSNLAEFRDRPEVPTASPDSPPETTVRKRVPVGNPFAGLETSGDALRLAKLLSRHPDHPDAAAVRERLRAAPIIAVQWEGGLPVDAKQVLTDRMLLNCPAREQSTLEQLGLGLSFVNCTIEVRYASKYKRGLGRRIGNIRLAPHPKTLEIEVRRSKNRGRQESVVELEFKTPRITNNELTANGLSDPEVWAMTIETKLERLNRALSKLTRGR